MHQFFIFQIDFRANIDRLWPDDIMITVMEFKAKNRVSVKGLKSLGSHFACLCGGFEFYEVKKNCYYFSKRKWKYFYTFYHFYSEKSSKRAK